MVAAGCGIGWMGCFKKGADRIDVCMPGHKDIPLPACALHIDEPGWL